MVKKENKNKEGNPLAVPRSRKDGDYKTKEVKWRNHKYLFRVHLHEGDTTATSLLSDKINGSVSVIIPQCVQDYLSLTLECVI